MRGLAMVVMALDHTRDFFSAAHFDPADLARTTIPLFFTRWVTHFCAPIFVLLAGTSAWLYGARAGSRPALARFLLTRGLWLVVLELTVVRFAWLFQLGLSTFLAQVIWAIGWSMVVLAGLVFLPLGVVAALALAVIVGHDLTDGVTDAGPLWTILHVPGWVAVTPGTRLFVAYPLVPWIAVMAAGWALGPWLLLPAAERRRRLVTLGAALTAAFVVVRALDGYGDPSPWAVDPRPGFTTLSFLDTTKYPPSLLYLLMTLGPAIALLGLVDREPGPSGRVLVVFGRVPLFYYVLHLYVLRLLAGVAFFASGHTLAELDALQPFSAPTGYGFGLGVVFAVWLGVVAALYPACRWFADLKRRRRDWWLSYV